MTTTWGWHFTTDVWNCNHEAIISKETVSLFAKKLVERLHMQAYGDPQVVDFGTGTKAGFTLVQLIETSNISGHFSNETDCAFIDVFSCKFYDPVLVIDTIHEFFGEECHCHNIRFWTRATNK